MANHGASVKANRVHPRSLTEDEVRDRIEPCQELAVINELYGFGQALAKEVLDRIRALESKAVSFAAYGTGLVAFLASSGSMLQPLRGSWSLLIEVCAALCATLCAAFSVKVLLLREFAWVSEEDWLKSECISSELEIKKYRVLTLWHVIRSHGKNQRDKARDLKTAQKFLGASSVYLFYLVAIAASVRFGDGILQLCWHRILAIVGTEFGQWLPWGGLALFRTLLCALPICIWLGIPRRRPA